MLADFVGTWKFEYDAEMRDHWERHLRASLADHVEVAEALAAVEAEAADAEIEIMAAGEIASRSGGREFYRASLATDERPQSRAPPIRSGRNPHRRAGQAADAVSPRDLE